MRKTGRIVAVSSVGAVKLLQRSVPNGPEPYPRAARQAIQSAAMRGNGCEGADPAANRRNRACINAATMRSALASDRASGQCWSSSRAHWRATASSAATSPIRARICRGAASSPRSSNCCASRPAAGAAGAAPLAPNSTAPMSASDVANGSSNAAACARSLAGSRVSGSVGNAAASRSQGAGCRCNASPSGCRRLPCDQPWSSSTHHASFASPGRGSLPAHAASVSSCCNANQATAISRCDEGTNASAMRHSGQRACHLSRKPASACWSLTADAATRPDRAVTAACRSTHRRARLPDHRRPDDSPIAR